MKALSHTRRNSMERGRPRPHGRPRRPHSGVWLLTAVIILTVCRLGLTDGKSTGQSSGDIKRDLTMKTFGGRQFWGDIAFFHGWRIQQNVFTGHYRLLDKDDYRHASGSLEDCRKKLEAVKTEQKLPPMRGKAVVVVHGVFRSSKSFGALQQRLEKNGYTVVGFDYPSTRVDLAKSAEYLHNVVQSLDGIEQIDFVVHSMGGLLVRQYFSRHKDKRVHRLVMLGVPNNGAQMADKLQKVGLFKLLFGPAGQQLISPEKDMNALTATLPVPFCEFAVIAGARGTLGGYNPLIPGDDDGTVTVASTRLPGAADFMTVACLHSFLMGNEDVIASTVQFLKNGHLRKSGKRHAIPKPVGRATVKPEESAAGNR